MKRLEELEGEKAVIYVGIFCWGFQAAPNAAAAFSVRPTRHNVNGGVVLSLADKQRRAGPYPLVQNVFGQNIPSTILRHCPAVTRFFTRR